MADGRKPHKQKLRNDLTAKYVRSILTYSKKTGIFKWKHRSVRGFRSAGKIAGCADTSGHIQIKINGISYLAHRLAWLYVKGRWPSKQIDHENVTAADNRWQNLRRATHNDNTRNIGIPKHNTSGIKGVRLRSDSKKWNASIRVNRRLIALGCFGNKEEAHAAYCAAAKK